MKEIIIDGQSLTIDQIGEVALSNGRELKVKISDKSLFKMQESRNFCLEIVEKGEPVYGINTGFGALSDKNIAKSDLAKLQVNLIRSHCTGVGAPFDVTITRAIMLLRANCLTSGFSGVNPSIVQLIVDFLNFDIIPVVPKKGSVGASGDLAPLSHIALALIGEGDVLFDGKIINSSIALQKIGKKPAILGPKDGLALINGTAVMAALGSVALYRTKDLFLYADIISSLTIDGVKGSLKAFNPKIAMLKPHPGQLKVVENINFFLKDSNIINSHETCSKVQDPYSLRCISQVHGACRQTINHCKEVFDIEINAVTDNPLIFVKEKEVISGGNFHGEAVALAMDYLAMGLSEIGNISERRIEKMMNPTFSELPAFLIEGSGLNSGLMIAHVTSAALASENKGLCHPSSVDSIPTSTDKEDHVSMGVTSGRKLYTILENVKNILAVELLCATTALDFQRPLKSSPLLEEVYELIRKKVPKITEDRVFATDINNIVKIFDSRDIISIVKKYKKDIL